MRRIFKIGERVWWNDDHMSGWGKISLVNRDDKYPEYICSDEDDDIITVSKSGGGEIETTPSCIYQLAKGRHFQGEKVVCEHNENVDYPFYCPAREENCYHFEVDKPRATSYEITIENINNPKENQTNVWVANTKYEAKKFALFGLRNWKIKSIRKIKTPCL